MIKKNKHSLQLKDDENFTVNNEITVRPTLYFFPKILIQNPS